MSISNGITLLRWGVLVLFVGILSTIVTPTSGHTMNVPGVSPVIEGDQITWKEERYPESDALYTWNDPQFYSTIQTADVDGDGRDELLARGAGGMLTYRFNSDSNSWELVASGDPPWTSESGWAYEQFYSTIQTADVDGDGRDELLARAAGGMETYRFNVDYELYLPVVLHQTSSATHESIAQSGQSGNNSWELLASGDPPWTSGSGWEYEQFYSTIQTADVDGDGRDELLARAAGGMLIYRFNSGSNSWELSASGDRPFSDEEIYLALATKFAPQLRFDDWNYTLSPTIHYPMSAKVYYEKVVTGPSTEWTNTDPNKVSNSNVPTYWKISNCGNQIRILYWWYYGRQDCCDGTSGDHDGDWEHVMVILSEDTTRIAAVTFYQHGGRYTRVGGRSDFSETYENTHPVIYVGRQAHGSYNYTAYDQSCCYWADHRNGNGPHLRSWENLIQLRPVSEGGEAWMDADLVGGFDWGGIGTHPMQVEIACNYDTCRGTPTWGCHESGCWKSQCEVGDRDDGITCWHCAAGYTDCGAFCAEGGAGNCLLPWKWHDISTYGLEYGISTSDRGLLYKNPGW